MSAPRVFVTGATGMIGRAVVTRLQAGGAEVIAAGRRGTEAEWRLGMPLGSALKDVDVVVHLAARVHGHGRDRADSAAFNATNVDATVQLAEEAQARGVRRFVFMSSIGVLGTTTSRPLREDDPYCPLSAYTRSKRLAEERLAEIQQLGSLEVVILRPPAVIGAGMKGNPNRLLGAIRRGLPLPFASIDNRRQFIGLRDLADAVALVTTHRERLAGVFHAADPEIVSTPALCRMLARAAGVKVRLWHVPVALLRAGLTAVGRRAFAEALTGDLLIDTQRLRIHLGWQPRQGLESAVREAVGG